MTHPTHDDRLLQQLQGILSPEEDALLQRDLAESPALRAELETLRTLQGLLRTSAHTTAEDAIRPFLVDRVMRRLAPAPQPLGRPASDEEFFGSLLRLFRPVAVAGLLLVLGLASYNVVLSNDFAAEPSTTEAVLALPPVTLATAYDADL